MGSMIASMSTAHLPKEAGALHALLDEVTRRCKAVIEVVEQLRQQHEIRDSLRRIDPHTLRDIGLEHRRITEL